jgi:hypothetical protein
MINPKSVDNFTTGEKNITFKVDCSFCKEPITYQNITICIYDRDLGKECGEKYYK